jgi:hypothetical protein
MDLNEMHVWELTIQYILFKLKRSWITYHQTLILLI